MMIMIRITRIPVPVVVIVVVLLLLPPPAVTNYNKVEEL